MKSKICYLCFFFLSFQPAYSGTFENQPEIETCSLKNDYSKCFVENIERWSFSEPMHLFKLFYEKKGEFSPKKFRTLSRLFFYFPFDRENSLYLKLKQFYSNQEKSSLLQERNYLKILYEPGLIKEASYIDKIRMERMKIFVHLQNENPLFLEKYCEKSRYEYKGKFEQSFLFHCIIPLIKKGGYKKAKRELGKYIKYGQWIEFTYQFLCRRLDKSYKKNQIFKDGTFTKLVWDHYFENKESALLKNNTNPTGMSRFYESLNKSLLASRGEVSCK